MVKALRFCARCGQADGMATRFCSTVKTPLDLNSTNGTFVNGKAVKKQLLNDSDTVEIGKYKIKW